jgi:hypothetical protein
MEIEMKNTTFEKVKVEEGLYPAVFKDVKEISEGQYGPRVALIFDVEVAGPEDVKELSLICYKTQGWGSRFGNALMAVGASVVEGKLDTDSLKGKRCKVLIENYEDKDKVVISGVSKVKPISE